MAKNDFNKSSTSPSWQGRSGLDPVDTSRIEAHADGVFLRRLFTLNLRTRNIFSLIVMSIFGIGATGLMGFAIYATITSRIYGKLELGDYLAFGGFYCLNGFILLIGIALLLNFFINLGIILGYVRPQSGSRNALNRKEAKKRLPKRRKDYQ